MKRTVFSIMFFCCAMAMAAQNTVTVKFQGAKPTISDFVWALINEHDKQAAEEEEGCADESFNGLEAAWKQHHKGQKLGEGNTLTIDTKNGYVCFEYKSEYEQTVNVVRVDLCYWNEADQKHKLLAYNVQYGTGDGGDVAYELPRSGKNIIKTTYWPKTQKVLKKTLVWNGSTFTEQ